MSHIILLENLDLGVFEPYILTLSKARKNDRTKVKFYC